MATPSGQIAFSQVNAELGVSPTSTQANLGSAPFRGLAGVPSGQISMSNLQNKSSYTATSATGGDIVSTYVDGGVTYKYHIFESPGSFIVSTVGTYNTVDILLVGGGGAGGGGPNAGGGGGGGVIFTPGVPFSTTSYPIIIGGGSASTLSPDRSDASPNGSPSTAFSITAGGGGGGGGRSSVGANGSAPGGSGGGSGLEVTPGGTGSPPGGNGGGGSDPRCGGGGGAGGSASGRTAGPGVQYNMTGTSYYWGGGGGGAGYNVPGPEGNGGAGGGGAGSGLNNAGTNNNQGYKVNANSVPSGPSDCRLLSAGATNTGGGGGGNNGGWGGTTSASGNGGSGICIIRYRHSV